MNSQPRWDRCIYHRGGDAEVFFRDFFEGNERTALLVAGAGFDPRSVHGTQLLVKSLGSRITGLFIREERPNPPEGLKKRADENEAALRKLVPNHRVETVRIFDSDVAVIGGPEIVQHVKGIAPQAFSDIMIDASALSTGILFPLTRYFLERLKGVNVNLHMLVAASSHTDNRITAVPHDATSMVHGFKGGFRLFESKDACKLWLPQLVPGQGVILSKIYSAIAPDLVCPILPFPSRHCRMVDDLLEEYAHSLENWNVDNRNFVFAAEDDPLDLYRTILQIDRSRSRIFREIGGSKTIISPLGSKLLAIGSLLAALEKDFPVVYVESIAYNVQLGIFEPDETQPELFHLWLHGEAYSSKEESSK